MLRAPVVTLGVNGQRVAALVILALLAACDSGSSQAPGRLSPTPSGGVLRVITLPQPGTNAFPDPRSNAHADPVVFDTLRNRELFRCCLARTLLSYTGEPGLKGTHLMPDLASELPQMSADGKTWTFHLRHGLHYGPPLQRFEITARDFVHALARDAFADADSSAPYFSVIQGFAEFSQRKAATIAGLEVPDKYTLKVRLVRPTSDLDYRFSTSYTAPIPPLPGDESAPLGVATGHEKDYGNFLVSSGPYMIAGSERLDFGQPSAKQQPLSGLKPDGSVTLVRNPAWGRTSDPLRPAYVDSIEMVSPAATSRADAASRVESGEADLAVIDGAPPQVPLDAVRAFGEHPDRGRVDVQDRDILMLITMNLAVPPFDDVHVRKAVASAIDRRTLLGLRGGAYAGRLTGHVGFDTSDNDLNTYDPFGALGDASARIQSARAEMSLSRYDSKRDGACDAPACAHVKAVGIVDEGRRPPEMGELVKSNLSNIGITLDLSLLPPGKAISQAQDPTTHTAMTMFVSNGPVSPPRVSMYEKMYTLEGLVPGPADSNLSLVGATSDQLRTWGYGATEVPNIEDRVARCLALFPSFSPPCWTELDQYVTEELVADVPILQENYVEIVPRRVLLYSYDQAMDAPALDHVVVQHR